MNWLGKEIGAFASSDDSQHILRSLDSDQVNLGNRFAFDVYSKQAEVPAIHFVIKKLQAKSIHGTTFIDWPTTHLDEASFKQWEDGTKHSTHNTQQLSDFIISIFNNMFSHPLDEYKAFF